MLQQDISAKFLEAYKNKDENRVSVMRLLKTAIANKMIEKKMGKEETLADDDVIAIIKSEVKKRADSIEAYTAGNRADLADKEKSEMEILAGFLPEQMSEEQVREIVKAVIAETGAGAGDFGKVMGNVMARSKGQTDGTIVSKLVKEELGK